MEKKKNFKGLFHTEINIIYTKKFFLTGLCDLDPTGKSNSKRESSYLSLKKKSISTLAFVLHFYYTKLLTWLKKNTMKAKLMLFLI